MVWWLLSLLQVAHSCHLAIVATSPDLNILNLFAWIPPQAAPMVLCLTTPYDQFFFSLNLNYYSDLVVPSPDLTVRYVIKRDCVEDWCFHCQTEGFYYFNGTDYITPIDRHVLDLKASGLTENWACTNNPEKAFFWVLSYGLIRFVDTVVEEIRVRYKNFVYLQDWASAEVIDSTFSRMDFASAVIFAESSYYVALVRSRVTGLNRDHPYPAQSLKDFGFLEVHTNYLEIFNCYFEDNYFMNSGGLIVVNNFYSASIRYTLVRRCMGSITIRNSAPTFTNSALVIADCRFDGNNIHGGLLSVSGGVRTDVTLERVEFYNNLSHDSEYLNFLLPFEGTLQIHHCVFVNNRLGAVPSSTSLILVKGAKSFILANSTFVDNGFYTTQFPLLIAELLYQGLINDSPMLRALEMQFSSSCMHHLLVSDISEFALRNTSFTNAVGNNCVNEITTELQAILLSTSIVDELRLRGASVGLYFSVSLRSQLTVLVQQSSFSQVRVMPLDYRGNSERESTLAVDKCEFVDTGDDACQVGGIQAFVQRLQVTDCTFSSIHCDSAGGVINFVGLRSRNLTEISIFNSRFNENDVSSSRGVVNINSRVPHVKFDIIGCEFTQSQRSDSALLFIDQIAVAEGLVRDCHFQISAGAVNEILLLNHINGTVRIADINFSGFTMLQFPLISVVFATSDPNAVPVTQLHRVTIAQSDLYAALSVKGNYYRARVESIGCVFTQIKGTVVDVQNGNFTDYLSVFSSNINTLCLKLSTDSSAAFTGSTFLENTATASGIVSIAGPQSEVSFSDCTFSGNNALEEGKLLYIESSASVSIQRSRFLHSLGPHSTILSLVDMDVPLEISHSILTENQGIAYASDSYLHLRNVTINSTLSTRIGFDLVRSSLVIIDSELTDFWGELGCVVYSNLLGSVTLAGTEVRQSHCEQALFWLSSGSQMTIDNSLFDNVSSLQSSIIYVDSGGSLNISFLTLTNATVENAVLETSRADLALRNSSFTDIRGTVIYAEKAPSVRLDAVAFSNVSATLGAAGLFCDLCTEVSVIGSTFTVMNGSDAGAISVHADSARVVNSSFSDSVGVAHGAIKVAATAFVLERCQFQNNRASGMLAAGGAVELVTSSGMITDCSFQYNKADIGGAIHWSSSKPTITLSNSFLGNEASRFGQNFASYVFALRPNATILPEFASGQIFQGAIGVDMVDHYGQVVSTPDEHSAMLVGASLSGKLTATAVSGHFTFSGFAVTETPGTTVNASIELLGTGISHEILISLRDCIRGEIEENKACVQCAANSYSLYLKSAKCSICPSNAICRNGHMYPLSGYWRPDEDFDNVLRCPRAESCVGYINYTSQTGYCVSPYTGNLCQSCTSGASRSSKDQCEKCADRDKNILRLSFAGVGVFAIIVVLTRSAMTSARKEKGTMSTLLKIFLNYLQLTMMISHFELRWPHQLKDFFSFHESVGNGGEQFISVDCLFADAFFKKVVAAGVLPVFLLATNFVFWTLVWIIYQVRKKPLSFKQKIVCSLIVSLFYFYPFIVRSSLSAFQCETIRPGEWWVRMEMNYRCWDKRHSYYALAGALPTIVLWGVGIPALALLFLVRYRKELGKPDIKNMVGFLSEGYRTNRFYWDVVIMYRKLCILLLYVFMSSFDTLLQALALGSLLWASAILQNKFHAFTFKEMNRLELLSNWACLATTFAGLCFSTRALSITAETVLFALVLIANVFFIALMLKSFVVIALMKIKRTVLTLASKVRVSRQAREAQSSLSSL